MRSVLAPALHPESTSCLSSVVGEDIFCTMLLGSDGTRAICPV